MKRWNGGSQREPVSYTHLNRLGIAQDLTMDKINYNLAHELAHSYLHYDKGDTIHSERHAEYEEQADRAAEMLLELIKTA